LAGLLARDGKVACLSEVVDKSGERLAYETAYDRLNPKTDFEKTKQAALDGRACERFTSFDASLSFSEVRALQSKRQVDRVAAKISQKRRARSNAKLLRELDNLANRIDLTPQQRGKLLEEWFQRLFTASNLSHTIDVSSPWEQLDFTVSIRGMFYIGEIRWRSKPVSARQIRDFFGKLMDRPPFVVGIVMSMSGFTTPAVEWIKAHTHDRTVVLVDQDALRMCLSAANSVAQYVTSELAKHLNHPRK